VHPELAPGKGGSKDTATPKCGGKKAPTKEVPSKTEVPINDAIQEVVEQTFEEVPTDTDGLALQDFGLVIRTFNRWDRLSISFLINNS
jgi:hypothetical protein